MPILVGKMLDIIQDNSEEMQKYNIFKSKHFGERNAYDIWMDRIIYDL
jgi:hypothetical protein